jgi:hypothetical protein
MDILDNVVEMAEEKIEDVAGDIAEKLPENVVDGAEDMINNATGMDLDMNGNDVSAEDSAAE